MKTKSNTIVIIGAGNVATQLGLALKKAKHPILQVFSKRKASAAKLAKKLNCSSSTTPSKLNPDADIYIIAVSDDAINDVVKKLNINNKIVVHTTGSTSIDALKKASTNIGVFYPLQTFSINRKVDFSNIPICIEACNNKTLTVLKSIAKSISKDVKLVSSDQRKAIHLAAVFACNFTNHFYAIAENILNDNQLSLDIIKPLIAETTEKIKKNSPAKMQTGPAIRGDNKTIKKQLALLTDKEQKKIYELVSKSIAKQKLIE